MSVFRTLAFTAAIGLTTLPAAAQDPNLAPNFGTIRLTAGFEPDPHIINLQAGGDIDAQTISPDCVGYITNTPDIRMNFTNGSGLPLIISVASGVDTTLVVNAPDGRWYCNDDGPNGLNPSVRFNNPLSGRYEIFVGTFSAGHAQRARLHISELESQ